MERKSGQDPRWNWVERVVKRLRLNLTELEDLASSLRYEIFREIDSGSSRDSLKDDPRLATLIDVLMALSLLDESDPSIPWNRGSILADVGRHLEAARDFFEAAHRSQSLPEEKRWLDDEQEWAESSLYHASKNLVAAGYFLSSALILDRLSPENRAEIEKLLREAASERGTQRQQDADGHGHL